MAKYIAFSTCDWPEVVRQLRAQHQWQQAELQGAVDTAIDMLQADADGVEAVVELLKQAATKARPNPDNPGRWYFTVDCAEALAASVEVLEIGERTAVQNAVLAELGPKVCYKAHRRYEVDEARRLHLFELAEKQGMLNGMKAYRSE